MESIRKSERNHKTWLSNYLGNSLLKYQSAWAYWIQYLGDKNEAWILENKLTEDWGTHLVNFHRWLKKQPKKKGRGTLSDSTAKVLTNGIRGYLRHIGVGVDLQAVQKREISKIESNPTLDYPFNLQVKGQLLRVASPEEEYIVSAGVSFGLRIGDFKEITRAQLEPLLNRDVPIQLPKLMTKKEGIPAYPFIDRDAKQAIQRLLKENPKGKMLNLTQRQINTTLKDLFERAGINTEGYRVRFHILRKFLTDNLSSVCSEDKWKHFVGKSSKSPYVSHEGKEAFKRVMEFTCINGERARATNEEIAEMKKALEDENKQLRQTVKVLLNKIENLEKGLNRVTTDFSQRLDWLENRAKKKVKVDLT